MNSAASVEFVGVESASTFLARRLSHAKRYSAWRAEDWNWFERLKRILAAPMVALVLAVRGFGRIPKRNLEWIVSIPALGLIAIVWAFGETIGLVGQRLAAKSRVKRELAGFHETSRCSEPLEQTRSLL